MGLVYIDGVVKGPTGKEERVRFLIDSGVTYSLSPERVWKSIGLQPKREHGFTLADGTTIKERFQNAT